MPRILACALLVAATCGSSALGSSSEAASTSDSDAAIAKQLEAAIQDEVKQGFSGSVLKRVITIRQLLSHTSGLPQTY